MAHRETTPHFARLMSSNAEPADILGLAQACAPLDLTACQGGKNLLRLAIERSEYGQRWKISQLESLAGCGHDSAQAAWAQASRPEPLVHWLAGQLGIGRFRQGPEVAIRILQNATRLELDSCPRNRQGESILSALLAASSPADNEGLGLEPALACAKALELDLTTHRIERHEAEPVRALLLARCPEAFDFALSSGVDFLAPEAGKPLWLAWREAATSRQVEHLIEKLSAWGANHDSDRDESIRRASYFKSLGAYGGADKLRDRPDWAEVRDENGRTAMMALALGNGASAKSWMGVKKALPGAALRDNEGRSLWHCLLAKGKDAPSTAASFLRSNVPLELDAQGRGLLPSLMAMKDANGRAPSEHEMLFNHEALARAAKGQSAHLWFAAPDALEAQKIGDWIANGRYLGSRGESPQTVRSGSCLAALCLALDPLSFSSIPAPIAGALAINIATSRTIDPERMAAAAHLLGAGGFVELSAERQALFDAHAHPDMKSMVREAFLAISERKIISGHLVSSKEQPPPTSRRI